MKSLLRLGLGGVIAASFIYLLMRETSGHALREALQQSHPVLLLAAAASLLTGYGLRALRWRLLITQPGQTPPLGPTAANLLSSFALNNCLPLRAGDVYRVIDCKLRFGLDYGLATGAMVLERLMDLLVLLSLLTLMLPRSWLPTGLAASHLALDAATGILIILFIMPVQCARLADWLLARLTTYLPAHLSQELHKLTTTLHALRAPWHRLRLIALSCLGWGCEGMTYWFVATAMPTVTQPLAAWIALPVGTLATLIPSTPGFVGTFDYFAAQAMQHAGNTATSAIAYTLVLHLVLWLTVTAAGLLCLQGRVLRRIRSGEQNDQ